VPGRMLSKRATAWLTALFFLALTLLGALTAADYGQPWDEPWEQDILRLNLNQYAQWLGLPDRLTTRSTMQAPASGLIQDSMEKDHGECAYYPVFWLVASQTLSEAARMTLWHLYTWLWMVAGAGALWLICRRLGLSRLLSCAATLFLFLSPRMFAEGHYNNKDMVLLSLVLLTLWLALRLMEKPCVARALLFSLAGAATANTKVIGLMVWGLCALAVLWRQVAGRRMTGRVWGAAITALASFAVFYALLTPAMWADPIGYLSYGFNSAAGFTRWENYVLFRGSVFFLKEVHLPVYYLPYMILVTTPIWLILLIAAGQIFAFGRVLAARRRFAMDETAMALALCSLLWLLPLGFAVLAKPTLYNGWRHFYFLYGPMLALAAYGLKRAAEALRRLQSPIVRTLGAGALTLCMAVTGWQIAASHPNQYAYYNELVSSRENLSEYLELDYWNVSVLSTLRGLASRLPSGETQTIAGSDYGSQTGLVSAYPLLSAAEQAKLKVIPLNRNATAAFVLANTTYAVLNQWQPDAGMRAAAETRGFGQTLSVIYRRASE